MSRADPSAADLQTIQSAYSVGSALYFVVTVIQWLLGHAISTLGIDALTPVHVVVAAIVIGLAVWLSVRSARLRRSAAPAGPSV